MKIKQSLALAAVAALAPVSAFAQRVFAGFDAMINSANQSISSAGLAIVNFASVLIGVIGVVMLIWNYIKRSKGDASSNDALASWGFGLLFAALGLQVVKFIFFS